MTSLRHIMLVCLSIAIYSCLAQTRSEEPLSNAAHGEWMVGAPDVFAVKVETSKGHFILELHKTWAPKGVDRFYNLVRLGFFDDSRFYRVRENFIVQFGIAGKSSVAKVWEKEEILDDPIVESNRRGYITFAMTGPDTRTTQLYINLVDNTQLDQQGFAPIGYVTSGMDVVKSIYSGYGETAGGGMRGGKQQKLFEDGNAYLDKVFPKLDKLFKAEIVTK